MRLVYVHHGQKFLIQLFQGEINKRNEKENLPKEFLFVGEREIFKQVHLLKDELRNNGWSEGKQPSVTQPSFLRTDLTEDEVSFKFKIDQTEEWSGEGEKK